MTFQCFARKMQTVALAIAVLIKLELVEALYIIATGLSAVTPTRYLKLQIKNFLRCTDVLLFLWKLLLISKNNTIL